MLIHLNAFSVKDFFITANLNATNGFCGVNATNSIQLSVVMVVSSLHEFDIRMNLPQAYHPVFVSGALFLSYAVNLSLWSDLSAFRSVLNIRTLKHDFTTDQINPQCNCLGVTIFSRGCLRVSGTSKNLASVSSVGSQKKC